MLPYLNPRKIASVIVQKHSSDGTHKMEGELGEPKEPLMSAATDLIRAVHGKDTQAVAEALKTIFQELEEEPHKEGPHLGEPDGDE